MYKYVNILSPWLRAMHSAFVVLNAVSICNLDVQVRRHLANIMIYPILDFLVDLLMYAISGSQFLQKSALHHSSNDDPFGFIIIPLSLIFIRYLPTLSIACLWLNFGYAKI